MSNVNSQRHVQLKERGQNLDASLTPKPSYLDLVHGLEAKPYRLRTDADGFVFGPSLYAINDPSHPEPVDLVFIGGSTTECLYVDEVARFPNVVAARLVDPSGASLRVLNAGVAGGHSVHSLIALITKIVKYRPRVVVVMHNINDLVLLSKTGSYWLAPPSRELIQGASSDAVAARPPIYKRVPRIFKDALIPNTWLLLRSLPGFRKQTDEWRAFRHAQQPELGTVRADFKASLSAMVGVIRAWGATPVLMTQFNRVSPDDEFIREWYEALPGESAASFRVLIENFASFSDAIREVADAHSVPLIDLARAIPQSPEYMYDMVHLNRDGAELVGRRVAEALAANDFPESFQLR